MGIRHLTRIFARKARDVGFSGALKYSFKKATGILKREKEIETLYYIINHCIDITKVPPAKGELRKFQLCLLSVLKSFDAICKKQGWTYWLDYGTLLGAIRHGGFIPWDDDIDVSMPRKDYDEAMKKLPEICASYLPKTLSSWGGIMVGGLEYTPALVCVDRFPYDEIHSDSDDEAESIRVEIPSTRESTNATTPLTRGILFTVSLFSLTFFLLTSILPLVVLTATA